MICDQKITQKVIRGDPELDLSEGPKWNKKVTRSIPKLPEVDLYSVLILIVFHRMKWMKLWKWTLRKNLLKRTLEETGRGNYKKEYLYGK